MRIRTEIGKIVNLESLKNINKIIHKLLAKRYNHSSSKYIYDYSKNFKKSFKLISKILKEE